MAKRLELNEAEYLEKYELFLGDISDREFDIMPTKANFARYLGVPQKEVIYWYKQHPEVKDVIDQMTADTIIEGMCVKKYQAQAGALALKNLCKWQDNPVKTGIKQSNTHSDILEEKTAEKRLEEYSNNFEARRKALRVAK